MEEFYNLGAGEFSMDDIKRIVRLRSDFKNWQIIRIIKLEYFNIFIVVLQLFNLKLIH